MGAIASLFATIGIDTSSLDKGLGGSKSQLLGFGKELAKATIGTLSLATATYKAGKAVIDSIRDWADYADSMRLSAQMAGVTTEEMSRLTQAADDFRVPMETMQRSMEMALKNGFVPTIDNIAALSDELLTIKDPAERAAKASEIFGKSYADMMPFLLAGGDAIRDATDSISDSLVVTEEAAQQAKEYKDQLDALSDSWTGVKNTIGEAVIPVLTELFDQINDSTSISDLREQLGDVAEAARDAGKITDDQYNAIMKGAYDRTKTTAESVEFLEYYLGALTGTTKETADATGDLTDAEKEVAAAAIEAAVAQAELNAEIEDIKSLDTNFKGIIDMGYEYSDIIKQIGEQQAILADPDLGEEEYDAAKSKIEELNGALENLAAQTALNMLQTTIAIGGVTEAESKLFFDTAVSMGQMTRDGAEAAYTAYSDSIKLMNLLELDPKTGEISVDNYDAMMAIMAIEDMTISEKIATIEAVLSGKEAVEASLDNLARDRVSTVTVRTVNTGGGGGGGGGGGNTPMPRAAGGNVDAGTPYIVGERGMELFMPSTSGRIIPNDELGGRVINNYTLIMPTTANAGDVKMAFELMEAWA